MLNAIDGTTKPEPCRVHCDGRVPPPPVEMPTARMQYRCGMSMFGSCPALKSLNRGRQKRRRHRHGLWRRSRRHFRQRIEAMAILTEHPESGKKIPAGAAARIRRRAAEVGYDHRLYRELREMLAIQEALDHYLDLKMPFTPRRESDADGG